MFHKCLVRHCCASSLSSVAFTERGSGHHYSCLDSLFLSITYTRSCKLLGVNNCRCQMKVRLSSASLLQNMSYFMMIVSTWFIPLLFLLILVVSSNCHDAKINSLGDLVVFICLSMVHFSHCVSFFISSMNVALWHVLCQESYSV